MIRPMKIAEIATKVNLTNINLKPKNSSSTSSWGIFMHDQAVRKITMFEILAPFLIRVEAIGKAM